MYKITIKDKEGAKVSVFASDESELHTIKENCIKNESYVLSIIQKNSFRNIKTLNNDNLLFVTRIFHIITSSSIPLRQGLKFEIEENNESAVKELLARVLLKLETGQNLSNALETSGFRFSPYYVGMVHSGEVSGTLPSVFELLYGYLKKDIELKRQIIQASVYPLIMLVIALIVLSFLFNFVFPGFIELYSGFGKTLPWMTLFVFGIYQTVKDNVFIIPSLFAGLIIITGLIYRVKVIKKTLTALVASLPKIGKIMSEFFLYRFFTLLSVQVSGGRTVSQSLDSFIGIFGNDFYNEYITRIHTNVQKGNVLSKAMKGSLYTGRAIEYIRIGEESGKLPLMLQEAAGYYEGRVTHRLELFKQVLQPILIFIIGALIGIILVAVFLPIYSITSFF